MTCRRPNLPPAQKPVSATREEHEAALAAAAQIGPQRGILVDGLLPPLPHTPDYLAAFSALSPSEQWSDLPLERIDPRAPWRRVNTGCVWGIPRIGNVLIRGRGMLRGWEVRLLTDGAGLTAGHQLAHAQSGRPVVFDDRHTAMQQLAPVVHADGALPSKWAWSPAINLPDSGWSPVPTDKLWPELAQIRWRGQSGRWTVLVSPARVTVLLDLTPIVDPAGQVRAFDSVRAAKAFCLMNDGK